MLRKFFMLPILLLPLAGPVFGSVTLTDSLLVLAGEAENHDRIGLLNQVAWLLLDYQPASSLRYSIMALEASKAGGNVSGQAEALLNIGGAWIARGDVGKAAPVLDEAFDIYRERLGERASVRDYCHLARILMLKGQPDSSLDYYHRALGMAEADDLSGRAYCLGGMGESYWKMGQFMQSLDCFTGSLECIRETGTRYPKDWLLYKIALNYQRLGRYDEALRNLYASLTASRELNNLIQMGHTYQVAGSIYLYLGDFEHALEYHRKGLAIHEQLGDVPGLANALDVLADIYMEMERDEEALRMYNHSYELRRKMGNQRMIVKSQMNLGQYYTKRENYPLALSYYRDASATAGALQDKWSLARISVNLGEIHAARKEYEVALQFLEEGLSVVQDMGSRDIQLDAHYHLYELHRTLGNYQQSLEHYQKYATLREDMINVESRTSIANLESSYDLVNKENEIARLEKENMAKQLELQEERSLRNYLISLAVFLLLLGIIVALSLVRNRRMNLALKQKNRELGELNQKLTAYSEELDGLNRTKNRLISIISHDLKNSFQSLIGFSDLLVNETRRFTEQERLSFSKSINDTSRKAFELLQNLLDWARLQTSEIPFDPADLKVEEAVQSVMDLLKSHALDKGISMHVEIPPGSVVYADSRMFETILRNILSNAIKYTPFGGKVTLTVRDQDGYLLFDVLDTGVGMDRDQVTHLFKVDRKASRPGTNNEQGTGFGLILCREFVKKNGGDLTVQSSPGKGSTFSFTVPKRSPA
jgi:signal transduction histidine kinase/Tfp pilus assembly protein PilF